MEAVESVKQPVTANARPKAVAHLVRQANQVPPVITAPPARPDPLGRRVKPVCHQRQAMTL